MVATKITLNELRGIVKQIIKEVSEEVSEKRKDFAVNYVYKFYTKNKNFTPLAEPEISNLAGSINYFQLVSYGDKNYRINFYFSYLLNKKPEITIDLLDEDDYSLVKKIK
jgi:hypothetical protein